MQREDGYSPSEFFHGRRVRSYLPSLEYIVNVKKGKAAREIKDLLVKKTTKNNKPLKPLNVGDLCYRRHFHGKKTLIIESLCEVIKVRKSGESYYIWDLESDRIYLRNLSWIVQFDNTVVLARCELRCWRSTTTN